ncbi:caspase family protein [Myxococcus stipitatus]|uniref:caspase family protein n=1 Tax=Myxococcus stipitatus TaxID=83455 RepID=UPI0030CF94E0
MRSWRPWSRRWLLLVVLGFSAHAQELRAAGVRHALVIDTRGDGQRPIPSAQNDAEKMAELLERLDFRVTHLPKARLTSLRAAVAKLASGLQGQDVVLVYFSGHGAQYLGENYLVPFDAEVATPQDIPKQAYALRELFVALRAHVGPKIVLLDACRSPPRFSRAVTDALVPGFADSPAAWPDTVIGFATTPGEWAESGSSDGHSPYTTALLKFLPIPGVRFADILMRVRINVAANTQDRQVPWENGSARAHFYFRPAATATFQFEEADDDALVMLNGRIVSSWLRYGREPQVLDLVAGANPFTVFVYNDKTVGGGVLILGGKQPQGWRFGLTISTAQGGRRVFQGREDILVREGPRHGKMFEVVRGVLHVDEGTGRVSMVDVKEREWEP